MAKAKVISLVAVIVFLAVIGYSGYRWQASPSSATFTTDTTQPTKAVLGSETRLTSWQTSYFTTLIPLSWRLLSSREQPAQPVWASYVWTNDSGQPTGQLAISLGKLGNNRLAEASGVKFRLDSAQYQPIRPAFLPAGGFAFQQPYGYELSAFWQHGNDYVAVVASGSSEQQAALTQAVTSVIGNWQWQ